MLTINTASHIRMLDPHFAHQSIKLNLEHFWRFTYVRLFLCLISGSVVKSLLMQETLETWVRSLGQEDPMEKEI